MSVFERTSRADPGSSLVIRTRGLTSLPHRETGLSIQRSRSRSLREDLDTVVRADELLSRPWERPGRTVARGEDTDHGLEGPEPAGTDQKWHGARTTVVESVHIRFEIPSWLGVHGAGELHDARRRRTRGTTAASRRTRSPGERVCERPATEDQTVSRGFTPELCLGHTRIRLDCARTRVRGRNRNRPLTRPE